MDAIILARGGSKGIPHKNIVNFNGMPLIYYSINQALNSKYIQNVFVSSDDDNILNISAKYGAKIIKRPDLFALDTSPSEDALLHAINFINDDKAKHYCFIQATSPLRESIDIDNAVEVLINNNYDSVFSACYLDDFLIWKDNGFLTSINYDFTNRKRRQDNSMEKFLVETGSIYVFDKRNFLASNNRLCGKIGYSLMNRWKMFEIDETKDLELCEKMYKIHFGQI